MCQREDDPMQALLGEHRGEWAAAGTAGVGAEARADVDVAAVALRRAGVGGHGSLPHGLVSSFGLALVPRGQRGFRLRRRRRLSGLAVARTPRVERVTQAVADEIDGE